MNQEKHLMNMISRSLMSNIFGSKMVVVNSRLVANQGLDLDEVDKVNKLHKVRNCYLTLMENTDDSVELKRLSLFITQIDFQLQKLWKFKVDSAYHRFWELPKCQCPASDNLDTFGTGHRYINPNCKIHG
jgi:hypothetical protein